MWKMSSVLQQVKNCDFPPTLFQAANVTNKKRKIYYRKCIKEFDAISRISIIGLLLWIRKRLSFTLLKQFMLRLKYGKDRSRRMGVASVWFILIFFYV
jgi:hypothetical protein